MIARLWTGSVDTSKAREYLELMRTVALPDYRAVPGNLGAWCLHRKESGRVIVQTLSFWRDYDAIKGFAGESFEQAKYYDFDADFLLEMRPAVEHFEVID